jgi:site-specific recombinase XerD
MPKTSRPILSKGSATLDTRPRSLSRAKVRVSARDDAEAVAAWLAIRASRSSATANSYSKEIERLQAWCVHERGIAMSQMGVSDCIEYRIWLRDLGALTEKAWSAKWKLAQDEWIMTGKWPRTHEAWRPFYRPAKAGGPKRILTDASVDQAMRVVRSCFAFLRKVGYLPQDPWDVIVQESADPADPSIVERSLGVDDVAELWETVRAEPGPPEDAAEVMLVMALGLCCGLRMSEILALKGNSVVLTSCGHYQLEFVGKGNVAAKVPLPKPVIKALEALLDSRDLVLTRDRDALLFPSRRRQGQPLSRSYVYSRFKSIFELTAERIRKQGTSESRQRAARLRRASTHWLRHTFARTALSVGLPLRHIQKLLRHSSIDVTGRYVATSEEDVAQTAEASASSLSGELAAARHKPRCRSDP